jgi:signal transduction histidine kinase
VSHQLRTPLTGLRLHLETALANPTVDSNTAMTVALGEVDRLERTIDDLLALARDVGSDGEPLDVREVIGDVEQSWHGRLAAAGRPLRVEIERDIGTAQASRGAVRQVLDVLIANAQTHGQGAVRVSAQRVPGGVTVDVSDNGPGVEGDTRAIFERRSGGDTNHGIGLSLARSLAEAEGGRLLLVEPGPKPTFRLVLRAGDPLPPPFCG